MPKHSTVPKYRIVASIMGKQGGGKTDWLTTMPTPIVLCSVDPNTKAVVDKAFGDDPDPADIRLVELPYPLLGFETDDEEVSNIANDSWELLTKEVSDILHQRAGKLQPRSFGMDSGTELYQMNIMREFGSKTKISPKERQIRMGDLNLDFKGLFRALERAGVHVGVTHRVKDVYEDVEVRTPNGVKIESRRIPDKYDRVGHKEMGNICSSEVLAMFDPDREGKLGEKFGMRILRSRDRPALTYAEYWGKMKELGGVRASSFSHLAMLTYPGTTLKEWE